MHGQPHIRLKNLYHLQVYVVLNEIRIILRRTSGNEYWGCRKWECYILLCLFRISLLRNEWTEAVWQPRARMFSAFRQGKPTAHHWIPIKIFSRRCFVFQSTFPPSVLSRRAVNDILELYKEIHLNKTFLSCSCYTVHFNLLIKSNRVVK